MPAALSRFSSALHQSVMRWLRALLRRAIARDERVRIGRAVLLVVHVERLVGRDRIALVGHRRVEPVGQHFRPSRMRVERNVEIGLRQARQRRARRALHAGVQRRRGRFGLIRAHQRAAARIAEDHDALDALLAQPFHAGADVDQRMLEREQVLGAAIARVPAEEAVAARRDVGREVMLGEIAHCSASRSARRAGAGPSASSRCPGTDGRRLRRAARSATARPTNCASHCAASFVMLGARGRDRLAAACATPWLCAQARLAAEAERDAGRADERRAAVDAHGVLPIVFLAAGSRRGAHGSTVLGLCRQGSAALLCVARGLRLRLFPPPHQNEGERSAARRTN